MSASDAVSRFGIARSIHRTLAHIFAAQTSELPSVEPVELRIAQRVGAVPFGYDLGDDGIPPVPREPEQVVIEEMQSLLAAGWTLAAIAEEMTERTVPTKTWQSMR